MSSVRRSKAQVPAERTDGRQAELRGTARERVLEAAADEFVERGYTGASLQAIAKRAGLTRGAIYWNFENKQDLFLALLGERIDKPARALMQLTETAPPDQATAAAVSEGLARLIANQAPLVMLLFEYWAAAARDPKLRHAYNARQHELRGTLAQALEARHATTGVPLTYPAERLATAVLALAYGIAMNKLVDSDAAPDELLGEILDLLYDRLRAREQNCRPAAAPRPSRRCAARRPPTRRKLAASLPRCVCRRLPRWRRGSRSPQRVESTAAGARPSPRRDDTRGAGGIAAWLRSRDLRRRPDVGSAGRQPPRGGRKPAVGTGHEAHGGGRWRP